MIKKPFSSITVECAFGSFGAFGAPAQGVRVCMCGGYFYYAFWMLGNNMFVGESSSRHVERLSTATTFSGGR